MNVMDYFSRDKKKPCARLLKYSTIFIIFFSESVIARSFFNPEFLKNSDQQSQVGDLSYFDAGLLQAPGIYRVDIWLNGKSVATSDIEFKAQKQQQNGALELVPCLNLEKIIALGLKESYLKQNAALTANKDSCDIITLIPDASTRYDTELQRLDISIPQAALVNKNKNLISPEEFDQGISAFLMNYKFLASHISYDRGDGQQESYNLNLRPGMNIGAWRLRHYSNWSKTSGRDGNNETWDNIYTYLQRDIIPLRSSLILGQSSSGSDIFDSVGFTGVQLASDEMMEPENATGYAPVVRGIAKSNAKVILKQNGYQIYESYVSPGAFEITDLYQTGSNGDLQVIVQESDGSEQRFIVPYASLPVLRREGNLKYSVTSGLYRAYDKHIDKTPFSQASASYGLPFNSTLYGGLQAASPYQAIAAGIGKNMGWIGAVSADATQAWSKQQDEKKTSGHSWRVRYSKNITQTGTNFAIAGYRYSTAGFYTLSDVLNSYRDDRQKYEPWRVKNRTEMNINQSIGDRLGNVSIGGMVEDYWDNSRRNKSINASYNSSWKGISYSLGYSFVKTIQKDGRSRSRENDQIFSLMVSVPLGQLLNSDSSMYAFYNMNAAKPGETTHMAGLTDASLENKNLNWGIQQGYGTKSKSSGNVDLDYQGTYGELTTSYGYNNHSRRVSYGVSGGAVIHENGITLSQPLGESIALIETPGAVGTSVINHTGVKTDFRGYAVVPYVTPYRLNDVVLNNETLPDDVELDSNTTTVVPTRGAVVRSVFGGKVGIKGLVKLIDKSGKNLPFGTTITLLDSQKTTANFVGEDGKVYLTGLTDHGQIFARWGSMHQEQCKASYDFRNVSAPSTGIRQIQVRCL